MLWTAINPVNRDIIYELSPYNLGFAAGSNKTSKNNVQMSAKEAVTFRDHWTLHL